MMRQVIGDVHATPQLDPRLIHGQMGPGEPNEDFFSSANMI
jgi:hypothetical protein